MVGIIPSNKLASIFIIDEFERKHITIKRINGTYYRTGNKL